MCLKVPYKEALEVCPRVDAVRGEMLEPCLGSFCKVEWQALDDEEIVVPPACSIGEAKIFQPHGGVGVLRILAIQRCVKTRREWRLPNPFCEHLWAIGIWAWVASSIPNPRMSAMVVRVAVTVV